MSGMYLSEGWGEGDRGRGREGKLVGREVAIYIACIVVGARLMWSYYS